MPSPTINYGLNKPDPNQNDWDTLLNSDLDSIDALLLRAASWGYAVDSGTANTYAVTISPAPSAYAAGMVIAFKAANGNTGGSTLNVNGLGAKTLVKNGNTALTSGDIVAGEIIVAMYDGTNFQLVGSGGGGVAPINIQNETYIYAHDTGTANVYAVALSPAVAAYVDGLEVTFKVGNSNTGATTLNINGLGAKSLYKGGSTPLSSGDLLAGQVVTVVYDGTAFQLSSPAASVATITPYFAWGGDGSDGATIFDGTTTVLGLAPASSAYTMTRDIYCTNMTVNSGVTIKTNNYRIFCTGTLTVNGTIQNIGGNGTSGSNAFGTNSGSGGGAGTSGVNGYAVTGSIVTSGSGATTAVGASGGTGVGAQPAAPGSGSVASPSFVPGGSAGTTGAAGGAGGSGSGGAGGTSRAGGSGGSRTDPAQNGHAVNAALSAANSSQSLLGYNGAPGGSSSGSSGGGDGTNHGGGGGGAGGAGGNGGTVIVVAQGFVIGATGVISVNGGNGGNGGIGGTPTAGNCGGGGGGAGGHAGSGGVVVLIYHTLTNNGAVQVNAGASAGTGGAGGTGVGTGTSGSAGANGTTGNAGIVLQFAC